MVICNYLVHFIYRYDNIIHSSYEVVSLLPFLSEKHICILFLIKHTVLIECINMVLYETSICLNIKFRYNKSYFFYK